MKPMLIVQFLVSIPLLVAACSTQGPGAGAPATETASPAATVSTPVQPAAPAAVKLLPAAVPNADGYVDISVDELAGLLEQKNFTLVNVHIPYAGELPQTDLFIAYDKIAQSLDQLPAKDAPIVLYCRSGRMSTEAAQVLVKQGYTNVYELDGGMSAWETAGRELVTKAQ
ncbi:MAG: rhodanese-like domain-containing protein [Caldilineaceae bacterium]